MAPVRKSTSKKKITTSASSGIRKRPHAKKIRDSIDNTKQNEANTSALDEQTQARRYKPPYQPLTSYLWKKLARLTKWEDLDRSLAIVDDGPDESQPVTAGLTRDPEVQPILEKRDIFPFLKLPSELRNQIYQELIPSGYEIFYNGRVQFSGSHPMFVTARSKEGDLYKRSVQRRVKYQWMKGSPRTRTISVELNFPPVELNLFLVNKVICNEARAILYGQNTFNFNINAVPKKHDKTNVFGLFDDPSRKHLLRDLRIIALHVEVNDGSPLATKRHRERLQQFMQELQKYSHDENQKSLLEKLKVDWFTTSLSSRGHRYHVPGMPRGMGMRDAAVRYTHENQKKYIFGLEGLTSLSGVDEVEITGAYVPPWFIDCLTRCLKGRAEPPLPIEYPGILVRRKNRDKGNEARRTYRQVWMTTKKWCDPWLNWTEFADREGIDIPEVDRLKLQGLTC